MLNIFVCENDAAQRKRIETIIKDYILIEECDMKIAFSADQTSKLSTYLELHPQRNSLYILQLLSKEDIAFAAKIRKNDPNGTFVFITSSNEYLPYIFQHKIIALDCIVERDATAFARRLRECVKITYSNYFKSPAAQGDMFQVKNGKQIRVIPINEIDFFESHPTSRKVICHFGNQQIEFYGTIKDIVKTNPVFYRSHMSFVVNTMKIKNIDRQTNEISMENNKSALIAPRKISQLLSMLSVPYEKRL